MESKWILFTFGSKFSWHYFSFFHQQKKCKEYPKASIFRRPIFTSNYSRFVHYWLINSQFWYLVRQKPEMWSEETALSCQLTGTKSLQWDTPTKLQQHHHLKPYPELNSDLFLLCNWLLQYPDLDQNQPIN